MQWALFGTTAALAVAGAAWLAESPSRGSRPSAESQPRRPVELMLTGDDAAERRRAMLRRAVFEYEAADVTPAPAESVFRRTRDASVPGADRDGSRSPDDPIECRFLPSPPSGTSPKFDCVVEGESVIKVKYGRNPEIHAEAAATALLRRLGYPADFVTIVPRLRCYGCPRFPFLAMTFQSLFALPLAPAPDEDSYRDFTWVSIEHRFPAPAIETAEHSGWAWWEIARSSAPRAVVDAFRLTAMFLAHWDNKSENQRLVCLDRSLPPPDGGCHRPLAMIQDVGATFGPAKANLARWHGLPVWKDRTTCTISMAALPFGGASFPDGRISEAGRARLAARLAAISDEEVKRLFADARFPEFQVGTDDEGDLRAWLAAFRYRADQIVHARCPELPDVSDET